MDPDGLSIFIVTLSGVLSLALCFCAGAVCANDTERDAQTCLGFSNRLAGLGVSFLFACAFFVFGLLRLCAATNLWTLLFFFVLVLGSILCLALGKTKADARKNAFAAFVPIGALFAAPARLVFRLAQLSALCDVTEEDLLSLVDDVEEQSLIDENQKDMIAGIFELDDVSAGEIMTHRTEVVAVDESATAAEVVQLAAKEGTSRMPVYRKSMDDIVGIVYVKDLFSVWNDSEKSTLPVRKFMRSAMFVPETCRARELLVDFKVKHTQIAIVVDEYGGTSGIVTMEDILEEIVGNIQDEFDNEEEDLVQTADGLIASGSADLEDVFDAFDLALPEEDPERDFDSVGGLVTDRLGRIPSVGEGIAIPYGGILFTVLQVGERRVDKVKCTLLPHGSKDDTAGEQA